MSGKAQKVLEEALTLPPDERADVAATLIDGTRRYALHGFPYGIVYRAVDTRVIVFAVAHAKRRPGYWKSRLTWGRPPA